MKVAAVQMVSGASLEANLAQARSLLSQACDRGAELAVLPEYFAAWATATRTSWPTPKR